MRSTSIAAYHKSIEDGTITKRQREVLHYLRLCAPATARSLSKTITGAWKRLAELKNLGYVENCGTTKDPITHKAVYLWRPTDQRVFNINLSQPKRKPYKELEAENRRLSEMLTQALYRSSAAYDMGYSQAKMEDGVEMGDIC